MLRRLLPRCSSADPKTPHRESPKLAAYCAKYVANGNKRLECPSNGDRPATPLHRFGPPVPGMICEKTPACIQVVKLAIQPPHVSLPA